MVGAPTPIVRLTSTFDNVTSDTLDKCQDVSSARKAWYLDQTSLWLGDLVITFFILVCEIGLLLSEHLPGLFEAPKFCVSQSAFLLHTLSSACCRFTLRRITSSIPCPRPIEQLWCKGRLAEHSSLAEMRFFLPTKATAPERRVVEVWSKPLIILHYLHRQLPASSHAKFRSSAPPLERFIWTGGSKMHVKPIDLVS